jgi:hypothetical protein
MVYNLEIENLIGIQRSVHNDQKDQFMEKKIENFELEKIHFINIDMISMMNVFSKCTIL